MSLIQTFRVLDKNLNLATWKRNEVASLKFGDTITQNQNGPFVWKGKVLNVSADVIARLEAKQRVVRA